MKKKDLIIALVEAGITEKAEALEDNLRLQKLLSKAYGDLAAEKSEHQAILFAMRAEIESLKTRIKGSAFGPIIKAR